MKLEFVCIVFLLLVIYRNIACDGLPFTPQHVRRRQGSYPVVDKKKTKAKLSSVHLEGFVYLVLCLSFQWDLFAYVDLPVSGDSPNNSFCVVARGCRIKHLSRDYG